MGQDPSQIREDIERTRTEMGDTVDALAHKADVKSRVKESIGDKRERLRAQMSGTASRISDATPDREQVSEGAQQAVGVAQENPIGLALGGLAAGFLAGMLLPTTKTEDERIGPVADQVKDRAKETGQEALERGKEVATQVAEQASETAKEAGQQQAEELKSSAQEQAQEAGEAAQRQAQAQTSD
jgi:gas vesicle protein